MLHVYVRLVGYHFQIHCVVEIILGVGLQCYFLLGKSTSCITSHPRNKCTLEDLWILDTRVNVVHDVAGNCYFPSGAIVYLSLDIVYCVAFRL